MPVDRLQQRCPVLSLQVGRGEPSSDPVEGLARWQSVEVAGQEVWPMLRFEQIHLRFQAAAVGFVVAEHGHATFRGGPQWIEGPDQRAHP